MIFRKAILIIHGFAGGTYDEEELANYLELNRNFDVYQFTLPGHDKNIGKVKYEEWIESSENQVKWLISKGYNNIYLIGHSMGGVIASYIATKYSEIKKLVLAAPSFQYFSVVKDNINISKSIKLAPKVIQTYGKEEILYRILKSSPNAIKQFIELVKKYYDYPSKIYCPILIIQGKNDNIVPLTSSKYVYDNVKSKEKKLVYVEKLTHDVFRCNNKLKIYEIVNNFLKNKVSGGIDNI